MTFDKWYFRNSVCLEEDKKLTRQTVRYTTMREAWEAGCKDGYGYGWEAGHRKGVVHGRD